MFLFQNFIETSNTIGSEDEEKEEAEEDRRRDSRVHKQRMGANLREGGCTAVLDTMAHPTGSEAGLQGFDIIIVHTHTGTHTHSIGKITQNGLLNFIEIWQCLVNSARIARVTPSKPA
jgi:hypothetical protein